MNVEDLPHGNDAEADAACEARRRVREIVVILIAVTVGMILIAMIPLVIAQQLEIKKLKAELSEALERVAALTELLRERPAKEVPKEETRKGRVEPAPRSKEVSPQREGPPRLWPPAPPKHSQQAP